MNNLKEKLGNNYNDIVKCNFIGELDEMLNGSGEVKITLDDLKQIVNGKIVGTIVKSFNEFDGDLTIYKLNDIPPTNCILNIVTSKELSFPVVRKIFDEIKELYPNIEICFGTTQNDSMEYKYKFIKNRSCL